MSPSWNLGNDIVDLADPRHSGKAHDRRFMDRVFSEIEQEEILAARRPDEALWTRWAGKEAAFKSLSKSLSRPPTFIHADFQVRLLAAAESGPRSGERGLQGEAAPPEHAGNPPAPPVSRFGEVRHGTIRFPLRIEVTGQALHAVTWSPQPKGGTPPFSWAFTEIAEGIAREDDAWRDRLRPRFSSLEWSCVSHRASALARLAARRTLAASLGVDEGELEIGCGPGTPGQRIPKVLQGGRELPVDLTLSHHGRLLAWAFVAPAPSTQEAQSKGR